MQPNAASRARQLLQRVLDWQFPDSVTDDSHKAGDEHRAIKVETRADAVLLIRNLSLH